LLTRRCQCYVFATPLMNTAQWEAALAEFKQAHPFTEAKRYPGE